MDDAIAGSISFVVPRMAEDTNANVAQCVPKKKRKKEKQGIFCGERRNGHKWWEQVEVKRTLCMSGRRRLEILQLQEEEGLGESTRAALCYLKVCQHPHLQPITFQKKKKKTHPATYDFHPPVAGMPLQFFFFLPSSSSFHASISLNMATVPLVPPPPPHTAPGCCWLLRVNAKKRGGWGGNSKLNIWSSCRADV